MFESKEAGEQGGDAGNFPRLSASPSLAYFYIYFIVLRQQTIFSPSSFLNFWGNVTSFLGKIPYPLRRDGNEE